MRIGLLSAAAAALVLTGCGSKDRGVANQPPHVEIVGSPVEGDSVNYVVDLFWHGWDDDGAIARSEYAVDIPPGFTPEQIEDPATPGIEWTTTTDSRVRIRFRAAPPESIDTESGTYPTDRASAPHTFFVRTYDNEGAHSAVAERSFNAWTVLPRTTLTEPTPPPLYGSAYLTLCRSLTVRWTGVDPDGRAPDYRPVRTEYKLIPVGSVLGITDANYVVLVDPGPTYPWVRVLGDSAVLTLTLDRPKSYVLALRSIDEAGGTESRFEFWRNALLVQSSSGGTPGRPTLQVREAILGTNVFPNDGEYVDYEVFADQCLHFQMSADAQSYGGTIEAYRWCVDAAEDPADAGTPAGCVPWGKTPVLPPICFATPGIHTVAFAVRSGGPPCASGGTTTGTYRLNVIPRYFDRDVLYVDDIMDPVNDAETDRRFLTALRNAGFERIDSYSAWGKGDLNGVVEQPTLAFLSRYRLLFWAVRGVGGGTQNGVTALLQASSCPTNRILQTYVAAGGGVWINGETVFGALRNRNARTGGMCLATTGYSPDTGLSFVTGDFVGDYLHLVGGDIRSASTGSTTNGLLRAEPTARALAEGLPPLEADSTTYAYGALGGLPFYDAMFQPTFVPEGGLDTLYTARTVRWQSAFNRKPIGWRYADPSPTPRQGPVAVTSFPLHRMKEGAPSRVVDGVRVPGTGLNGLVEVLGAWFRANR